MFSKLIGTPPRLDSVRFCILIARQHALHAERNIVLPIPSACPSVIERSYCV